MSEETLSNNPSQIELEIKRFLSVPIRLKTLRECLLFLHIKMANDATDDITVEKSSIYSTDGTNKTIYTVTVYN